MPETSQTEPSRSTMAPSGGRSQQPAAVVQGGNSAKDPVVNGLVSSSASNLTASQRKNRINVAKYYDIANTILAGGADLEEVFLAAARDGDYDKIEQFLQGHSIIVCTDTRDKRTGNTPLIWAAKKGHTKIVHLLLKHGADQTLRNYEGQTAVEVAPSGIKLLLLDSAERATESSHRLLLQAAWQGNVKVVKKLLTENKVLDINCQNADGQTPVLLVTRDIQLFERMSTQLNRPYHPVEVLQELLASRANIHAKDSEEKTCLHYASFSRASLAQSLVDLLIKEGSGLEVRDKRHFMPIHWASHSGNTNVVATLIDGGSEVNSRGYAGLTPLHITAHNDHHRTAVVLLERGANVTVTDDRGLTALDMAKTRRMKATLKEAWADQMQNTPTLTLAPVRAPSREESRVSVEDSGKRRKGEVIFDGLITPTPSRAGPASRPTFSRSISNADKARLAEKQMIRDIDNGRYTPTLKDNIRRLGSLRGSTMKVSSFPKVGTPSSSDRLSPESPSGRKSSVGDIEVRRSLEDGRNQIGVRRSKSLKHTNLTTDRRRITPLPSRDGQEDFCVQSNRVSPISHEASLHGGKTHRRVGSDPFIPPSIADLTSTCDTYLPRRGRSLSNGDSSTIDNRISPLRTPLEREPTNLNIPTTIPEVLTPRSSASTILVDVDMTLRPLTTAQVIVLPPNSSHVLPPTPTLVSQKSYSILEGRLMDGDSSKESSPRSDDELPKISGGDRVRLSLTTPMELLRGRSLLKEDFVLDESRPKDPLLQSSGSDPTSSTSSMSSSSPRDHAVNILVINRTGNRAVKGSNSPLSRVSRYSIGGHMDNVAEQFRSKVTRSRSFSSSVCKSRSESRLCDAVSDGRSDVSRLCDTTSDGSSDVSRLCDTTSDGRSDVSRQCGTTSDGRSDVSRQCDTTSDGRSDVSRQCDMTSDGSSTQGASMKQVDRKDDCKQQSVKIGGAPAKSTTPEVSKNNAAGSVSGKLNQERCSQPSASVKVKQGCSQSAAKQGLCPSQKSNCSPCVTKRPVHGSPASTNVPKVVKGLQPPNVSSSRLQRNPSPTRSAVNSANVTSAKSVRNSTVVESRPSQSSSTKPASQETPQNQQTAGISGSITSSSNVTKPNSSKNNTPLVEISRSSVPTSTPAKPSLRPSSIKATGAGPATKSASKSVLKNSSTSASTSTSTSSSSSKVSTSVSTQSKVTVFPESPSHPASANSAKQRTQVKAEGSSADTPKKASVANVPNVMPSGESLRSPSDSQLSAKTNSRTRPLNPTRKSDTWKYVKPCQDNKEPLVRISLPGEEPRPQICEPCYVANTAPIQTPLIVNPFENWIQPELVVTPRTPCGECGRGVHSRGIPATSYGYVIGKSTRDATCKLKKTRVLKSAKKIKDNKRPVSGGQRQSSGRRRSAKSRESKTRDSTSDGNIRVRSGKSSRRVKSGKKKRKDGVDEEKLKLISEKTDMALISGIGWSLAAGCNDTSDVKVAEFLYDSDFDDSDIEVIESIEPRFKLLTARTDGTTSPSTPRFLEIKPENEDRLPLPVMSYDGFPPMNLDMKQEVLPRVEVSEPVPRDQKSPDNETYSNHLDHVTNALHKEILLGKLTPISEAPSVNQTVQLAINKFDQQVEEDQLDKMLGITPRESLTSQQAEAIRQLNNNQASTSADSRLRRSGSLRKEVLTHETVKAKVKAKAAASKSGSSSASSKKGSSAGSNISKRNASLNKAKGNGGRTLQNASVKVSQEGTDLSMVCEDKLSVIPAPEMFDLNRMSLIGLPETPDQTRRSVVKAPDKSRPRGRTFSEAKKEEEEIDEAIEEILSGTTNSLSSTLKSNNIVKSLNSTLTDADTNVLKRLQNHDSVFHAKGSSEDLSQSDSYQHDTNPNLLKVFHAEDFKLGPKVKAMIDAGAEPAKVKAMLEADEEAKHLAKVMSSFSNMGLHAGGGPGGSSTGSVHLPRNTVPRPEASCDGPIMSRKPPLARPPSAGGLHKGKFQEINKVASRQNSRTLQAEHMEKQPQGQDTEQHVDPSIALELDVLEKLSEAVGGILSDSVANAMMSKNSVGETVCSRLSGRRGSRTGSACTEDSLSSSGEETIQWKKGNVLGKGAFGTVWCGLTNEGGLIAVKQIDLNASDIEKARREYEKVQEEVELLKNLRHRNIVGYMGTSFEDYTVSIFMQFVPGGSLASILARFGALQESVFRRYTKQILEGVEYLHDNDIIHRDIKGGNVMLMPTGVIKLIDFGCAKRLCISLSMSQSQILKSMKGTPYWMAPEVVNETGHGRKSDIWSVGCTIFEMATRKPPWADMNPMAAIFAIGSDKPVPTLPNRFSTEAVEFVKRCLTRDQNLRLSATQLLQDEFIVKRSSKK